MRFSRAQLGAGAAIVFAAGLVGCNNSEGGRLALTGSSYCTPFRTTSNTTSNQPATQSGLAAPAAASDPANAFDDCIHRWAYAMAPARDPADIVAHAVVDACGQAMNAWNQASMQASNGQDQGYQTGQAPSDQQGYGPPPGGRGDQQQMQQMQNSPIAQHMQIAEARSLFYVIQARSAGCAPPPANTLVRNPAA